ncbi:hypothetical protein DFH27DRAFT_654496 [Peziza echinospora]|nr:hypothetical protein DFH27DRAFT_654496 [Peziza echinospora]
MDMGGGMNMGGGSARTMDMGMGSGMKMDMHMDMHEMMGFDMMMFTEPPNWGHPRLNKVGKIYIAVFCVWTTIFAIGFAILWHHRNLPFIRLKNIPLVSWALALLHLQLGIDILSYPLNGVLPCSLEWWIMAVCLPLGIALFQAQNMQLISMSWGQRRFRLHYTHPSGMGAMCNPQIPRNFIVRGWHWWQGTCYLRRTYIIIGAGTGIQLASAVIIYLISRRFHSFGLVSSPPDSTFQCRAGWEWFASGIWQAIWTYGYGPFILFKIRNIQDTHRWRIQTTLAILFSLPALPLWLSTWFMPGFYEVNEHWPPTLWFVPGIAMMELIILFFPIYEIYEHKRTHKRLSQISSREPTRTFTTKYTQESLDATLKYDVDGLEEFASTKDFTGENIIFLREVAAWKENWRRAEEEAVNGHVRAPVVRAMFDSAEQIFFNSVSRSHSTFPLNLEDDVYIPLATMFCAEANIAASSHVFGGPCEFGGGGGGGGGGSGSGGPNVMSTRAMIAPFAEEEATATAYNHNNHPSRSNNQWDYSDDRPPTPPRKNSYPNIASFPPFPAAVAIMGAGGIGVLASSASQLSSTRRPESSISFGEAIPIIPPTFHADIFDEAEKAVMQIVLTNTWIRYVDSLTVAQQLKIEERTLNMRKKRLEAENFAAVVEAGAVGLLLKKKGLSAGAGGGGSGPGSRKNSWSGQTLADDERSVGDGRGSLEDGSGAGGGHSRMGSISGRWRGQGQVYDV